MKTKFLSFSILLTLLLNLSACETLGGKYTDLGLTFIVDASSNPDDNNVPAPLFVRLYELNSPEAFEHASFVELFERDQQVLGGDMLGKHRLQRLTPGQQRQQEIKKLNEKTRYVGLLAEFLQYRNAQYKVVFAVRQKTHWDTQKTVLISGNTMRLKQ